MIRSWWWVWVGLVLGGLAVPSQALEVSLRAISGIRWTVDTQGGQEYPGSWYRWFLDLSPGEVISTRTLDQRLAVAKAQWIQSGLFDAVTTDVTEDREGWLVTVHLTQNPHRDFRPRAFSWNWGSKDAWGQGNLALLSLSPWKQGVTVSTFRPGGEPWDLGVRLENRWDNPLAFQPALRESATAQSDYWVTPALRLSLGLWGQALQNWTEGTSLAALGVLGGVSYDGRFWKALTGGGWVNARIEGRRFVVGDSMGSTVLEAGVSGSWELSPWLRGRVVSSLVWSEEPNRFQPVVSPFGGLLPGSQPGVGTSTAGLDWLVWKSGEEGSLNLSWEPRIVGAAWVDPQGRWLEPTLGWGIAARVHWGGFGGMTLTGELTNRLGTEHWLGKVGLQTAELP